MEGGALEKKEGDEPYDFFKKKVITLATVVISAHEANGECCVSDHISYNNR